MFSKLVTWEQFITTNKDTKGVRFKFEDLCRQLFTNEFLSANKKNRNVHCNPNNVGIESDPVYDEMNQRWIGYQAKFFDERIGYDQILHSAEKTVEHYAGRVDHIFLYSNKPLSVEAGVYKKALDILARNNITLENITGETILDQVRKYPYLASYYFGSHSITFDWIKSHNKRMFAELGERFNSEFNVDTDFSLQLSLFVHDNTAIKYINDKKENLISNIDSLNWNYEQYCNYLDEMKNAIKDIVDVECERLEDSFQWESDINTVMNKEIEKFKAIKFELNKKQNELYELAFEDEIITELEKKIAKSEYFDIIKEIESIDTLLNLPSPLEYFQHELVNPLFLTLYCRTYKGDEVDLATLYERLISSANKNIHKSMAIVLRTLGYLEGEDLLTPFINELAVWFADRGTKMISKKEIIGLNYWNQYGIAAPPFILHIVREQILHNYMHKDEEKLYFAYDQMNDYFCAKAIVNHALSKDDVRKKIIEDILQIVDGRIRNYGNIDLFINICILYSEKYGEEECIDLIDKMSENYEKCDLLNRYIQSFQWRKRGTITAQGFLNLIRKYPIEPKYVWDVIIGNSVKIMHPLNSDFLHNLLMEYELNKRDYLWTTYINTIFSDTNNRIAQLIQMYDKGDSIIMKSKKQTELILTLFGWLLTASDRLLRDYTSKAMIEFLKVDFDLCEVILKKFEGVNDPYVIQRLYGVVFGACCKRRDAQNEVYQLLAEYIYTTIFMQEVVYPDILLRDYARLIIERFLWEQTNYTGIINRVMITPPYKSIPIPETDQDYISMKFKGGLQSISKSMKFENMGMYGNFGRYVFQRALRKFDVSQKQIFNYAMSFIIYELGYEEKWFDEFDCRRQGYNYFRHETIKVERIGKKYQWIAMYNILARVSDHYKMIDQNGVNDDDAKICFEGAWNPCVRDFDPTLNRNFMFCEDAPVFKQIDEYVSAAQDEIEQSIVSDNDSLNFWLENEGIFFANLKDTIILTDENGLQWVSLTKCLDIGHEKLKSKKLLVWSRLFAYFVTPEQEKAFAQSVDNGVDLRAQEIDSSQDISTVFNREYPWSPSCKSYNEYAWIDTHIKTGSTENVSDSSMVQDLFTYKDLLKKLGYYINEETDDVFYNGVIVEENMQDEQEVLEKSEAKYKKVVLEEEVKDIGKILHASSNLFWEKEFDASNPETLVWRVPCAEMIEKLHLRQLECDGFYYDKTGKLAAFDTNITQSHGGVVVRKDLLDIFLKEEGMKLIWILNADKEIHASDLSISHWSEWTALLSYDKTNVKGNIYMVKS